MAHVLAGEGAANRAELPPVWWLFAGPLLFAVIVTGWVWMLLAKAAAPWRAIAFAAAAVLVLVAASGAKGYYAVVAPPFMAAGALLLVSGPSVLLAWLKLRQRTLGPVLDATGWAINGRVRINVPLGAALTHQARLPANAERTLKDPYEDKAASRRRRLTALMLVLALLGLAAWSARDHWRWRVTGGTPHETAAPAPAAPAPEAAPAPASKPAT